MSYFLEKYVLSLKNLRNEGKNLNLRSWYYNSSNFFGICHSVLFQSLLTIIWRKVINKSVI